MKEQNARSVPLGPLRGSTPADRLAWLEGYVRGLEARIIELERCVKILSIPHA
jgi:hypothetical protein